MSPVKVATLVNIPQGDTGAVSLSFSTNNGDGAWNILVEWNGSRWSGWATLPSGEVRQFGCIPGVINWTGFPDFGLVWLSPLAAFGQPDLFGASLVLIDWGP